MSKEQRRVPPPYVDRRGLQGGEALRAGWLNPAWRKWKTEIDMAGRSPSVETREAIAASKRGVRRDEQFRKEMSRKHGAVKIVAGPLLLRGGSSEEVAAVTGFTKVQIDNLIINMRRPGGGLEKPTDEETSQRKSKAHLGKPRNRKARQYTPKEKHSFAFLRKFVRDELFADLVDWIELYELYRLHNRQLPESFTDRLRLELFLKATKCAVRDGDRGLSRRYIRSGQAIDATWFNQDGYLEEQIFIRSAVAGRR